MVGKKGKRGREREIYTLAEQHKARWMKRLFADSVMLFVDIGIVWTLELCKDWSCSETFCVRKMGCSWMLELFTDALGQQAGGRQTCPSLPAGLLSCLRVVEQAGDGL